jgi:CTP synthase
METERKQRILWRGTLMSKFIFVTGGVVSSLGKGIVASATAALLQSHGYTVQLKKMDPYLNVDPGTMSPHQHGEVFVTADGAETDLDLGHYERFTNQICHRYSSITAGRIYQEVISKERQGGYLGRTVQVVPHITDAIKDAILLNTSLTDFTIVEVGGTVGDIESLPFLESIRQLSNQLGSTRVMFVHVTLLPHLSAAGELKTKPTQHSVKDLLSCGISPHMLVCRTQQPLTQDVKDKIALFCNVTSDCVIEAADVDHILKTPLTYHLAGMDACVLRHFGLCATAANLKTWIDLNSKLEKVKQAPKIRIAIVGKYVSVPDSYKSLSEALHHAALHQEVNLEIKYVDCESSNLINDLRGVDGVVVPGGFGDRGLEGKIDAITHARINQIPFLGICLGMQLAVVELCRNLLQWTSAIHGEMNTSSTEKVVDILPNQEGNMGGTLRLGSQGVALKKGSRAYSIYGREDIQERHRHRYEVNVDQDSFGTGGVLISGVSTVNGLCEIIELPSHPWFIGVQFHPEFSSTPRDSHPLFIDFVSNSLAHFQQHEQKT